MKSIGCIRMIILALSVLISLHVEAQLPPNFSDSKIQDDLYMPIALAFSKDGKEMYVAEKIGRIVAFKWNGKEYIKQQTAVLDISEEVNNGGDIGLLSFCLDPNFESNKEIYLFYVVDHHHLMTFGTPDYNPNFGQDDRATISRVTKYKLTNIGNDIVANMGSRKILIGETRQTGIPMTTNTHTGGTILFGKDGSLLVSTGDNASFRNIDKGNAADTYHQESINLGMMRPEENIGSYRAQMLTSHCGKILRINPQTGDGISNNPFYRGDNPRAAISRVWALGFRNPFRMELKPNTGNSNEPGTLVVNDVGYIDWEDIHLIDKAGMNAGWPLYEGQEPTPHGYYDTEIKNVEENGAPTFASLCKQPNDVGIPNSASERRMIHAWPIMTWAHNRSENRTKVWALNNNRYESYNLGGANSGSRGEEFLGNCAAAGVFYTGVTFPLQYQNAYFMNDFGGDWLKTMRLTDNSNRWVSEVSSFVHGFNGIVDMKVNPLDGAIYYTTIGNNNKWQVRKLSYGGQQPPVAKMSTNKTFGASPLTVQLSSQGSYDPDGGPLTYSWNFGDGTTSDLPNPTKVFTSTISKGFTVQLTVTDNSGLSDTKTITIAVATDPPTVRITSPINASKYSMNVPTLSYQLSTQVTDADVSSLKYKWQIYLRHNTHEHLETELTQASPNITVKTVGCDGDTYYYLFKVFVTNRSGLVASDSVKVYPDCPSVVTTNCNGSGQLLVDFWNNIKGVNIQDLVVTTKPTLTSIQSFGSFEVKSNIGNNFGARYRGYLCVPSSGFYNFYIASDDDGELYLSTDNLPANKRRIAYMGNWNWAMPREWQKYPSQQSAAIYMEAGKQYYMEAIYKEGEGGDNLAIGWKRPHQNTVELIPGSSLSPLVILDTCVPTLSFQNCPTTTIRATTNTSLTAVNLPIPVAVKNCEKTATPVVTVSGIPNNKLFPVGVTTVVYTATADNLSATCKFDVTVTSTVQLCNASSKLLVDYWYNVSGLRTTDIPTATKPAITTTMPVKNFEAPTNVNDHFGARYRGYICAPETGNYLFYFACDDNGDLYLSTDKDPANAELIASVAYGFSVTSRNWTKHSSQQSRLIFLEAGKQYYIMALYKDRFYGDNMSVAWKLPSQRTINLIPGNVLDPYIEKTNCVQAIKFVNCPSVPIKVETTTTTATATWIAPSVVRECTNSVAPITLTNNFKPGDAFPLGTTKVNYTATSEGLSATCSFEVQVQTKPSSSTVFDAQKCYQFTARHSGKSLQVSDYDVLVRQSTPNLASRYQAWKIAATDATNFKIMNVHNSRYLSVYNASMENSAPIIHLDWRNSEHQQWSIQKNNDGFYHLLVKHSGQRLDVALADLNDGGLIVQWPAGLGFNQHWKISEVGCGISTRTTEVFDNKTDNPLTTIIKPNPANDYINIDWASHFIGSEVNIVVNDITGKSIYRHDLKVEDPYQIVTTQWPVGIYLLKLSNDTQSEVHKLIIVR